MSTGGRDDISLPFISIEVCERAKKEYTSAGCMNAISNRSCYDLGLLFVSMGVCEEESKK